jgi:chemotaxis protein CheD
MPPPNLSGKRFVLSPGEYFVSEEKVAISTLLGSCVAACLWDEQNRIIGMNHFLLANRRYAKKECLCRTEAGKYGIHSMELLINGMMKLGARRENLRAKAFGGASMIVDTTRRDNLFCVGEVNSHFIVEFLKTDGIPLVGSDLGGDVGRVIHFFSDDFAVYSRKMGKIRQEKIVQEEKGFWKRSTGDEKAVAEPETWL